ncbi:ECF transporter S component [Liquorilactobacillus oeni]|uniref:ECF transporter S component n=1 Tax=Liquorilactobacillus oeni DSM 19972 TaxID=1423777 RepID=A0A0R1MBB6_9LACO|nr:ECF transporter S component [Liquorilactobacillus oeni]KRL05390.1 hypothetical protein FD46_GL000797 [Liquorilactobacillus oeni DSM 19972]
MKRPRCLHSSQKADLHKITLIALLSALCVATRIIKVPVPNVQPVTDILIMTTIFLGLSYSLPLAVTTILLSNLILGFGFWTFPQITAYILVVMTIALLEKLLPVKNNVMLQTFLSVLMGFEYGLIVSLGMSVFGGLSFFWAYYLNGILFDTYHALGNFFFYPLLYQPLKKLTAHYLATK